MRFIKTGKGVENAAKKLTEKIDRDVANYLTEQFNRRLIRPDDHRSYVFEIPLSTQLPPRVT